jgi:hypothetical protein
MKQVCWILLMGIMMLKAAGQETEILQMLEDQAASNDAPELEEDLQEFQHLLRHPLNLNKASAEEFSIFSFISPVQVQRLMAYRNALGPLNNILELQAVPGWNVTQIRKIAPYVTVSGSENWKKIFLESVTEGRHKLLTRMGMRKMDNGPFPGSAPSFLLRYQYRSRFFAFSVNTEKDMGERIFQKEHGISFISFHLALYGKKNQRNMMVLGDYLVNMGQGLIHWQGRSVKKTGLPIMITRQLPAIQPYRSNDENRFHRGIAIVTDKGNLSTALFFSASRVDANRVYDSLKHIFYVSSLQTSGYHRTQSELDDQHSLGLISAGGTIHYRKGPLRLGINTIHHFFSMPYLRAEEPYRLYVFRGQRMANYSMDYYYTLRNIHFFGEAAADNLFHQAFVQGFMFSADPRLDLSILFRKISGRFYSLQGNAFTESTEPTGEEGIYAGASIKLSPVFTVDTYADFYRFPWLKYGIDLPGWGRDFLVQASWKPDKRTIFYLRVRKEVKTGNISARQIQPVSNLIQPDLAPVNIARRMVLTEEITRYSLRIHLNRIISRQVECRFRLETLGIFTSYTESFGYLFFSDLFWSSPTSRLSLNSRIMFYETTDYSSRIYAFENDVMYYNIIPSFYGQGALVYLNAGMTISRHCRLFIKGSLNREKEIPSIGVSGRFQLVFSW